MEHFLDGENQGAIRFRHIDWASERPKLFDLLKALALQPGEGLIIWRENKPYLLAGGYIVEAALHLDAIAKEAEGRGQGLTYTDIELAKEERIQSFTKATNEELTAILARSEAIEDETDLNPYNNEDLFREALDYGKTAHELTNADFALFLEDIGRRHPRIADHIAKERKRRNLT